MDCPTGLLDPLQVRAQGRSLPSGYRSSNETFTKTAPKNLTLQIAASDNALDFTVDPDLPYVPTDSIRKTVAHKILDANDSIQIYECGSGTHIKRDTALLGSEVCTYCCEFGECGAGGCGCNRMQKPHVRKRYRKIVVQRTTERYRGYDSIPPTVQAMRTPSSMGGLRVVTLGSGACLTDFEILLGLWSSGVQLASFIAIDRAYNHKDAYHEEYHRALNSLGVFFSPMRLLAFHSHHDFVAACER